jgi:preprotein translocase subunit SecD
MNTLLKSILMLLAVLTIATGFTAKPEKTYTILIGPNDKNISQTELNASAAIITRRLKDFGDGTFKVTALPEKSRISVELTGSSNPALVEKLITKKGVLGFYVVCPRDEFVKNLKDDDKLSSFLKASDKSGLSIGCTDAGGVTRANAYLETSGLKLLYQFAWSDFSDAKEYCLYALKINEKGEALAGNADIESFKTDYDEQGQPNGFGFNFRHEKVQLWADITGNNIGSAIAMVLDGSVIYTPMIHDKITGGKCQVTGRFSAEEIRYIVSIVNSGVLPAEFSVIK